MLNNNLSIILSKASNYFRHRVLKLINNLCVKYYKTKQIDDFSIVLESEGDCCDNSYALFDYMRKNGYLENYKITWLVNDPSKFTDGKHVSFVNKNYTEVLAVNTIKKLCTCKRYIYDHCDLLSPIQKRNGQTITYLCHGYAGFKAPKGKLSFEADEEFTTGDLPLQGLIDFHGIKAKKYILGFPRIDYFYNYDENITKIANNIINKDKFTKIVLWMPTFRKAVTDEISEDYFKNETGLPLLAKKKDLVDFNDYLYSINIKIVVKIHHLQANSEFFKLKFNNLQFVTDDDLYLNDIQLYQFIPIFDALITDYSSISTDFMLLEKPIIYILDDLEQYSANRGLYPDNALDLMVGEHVFTVSELKNAIIDVLNGVDKFKDERNNLLLKFHRYQDGCSSKRIVEHLKLSKDK